MPTRIRSCWNRTKVAANVDKFCEFYEVSKVYPAAQGPLTVVDKFSLDIRKGEFISLIGHSGCGKSTLFNKMIGSRRAIVQKLRQQDLFKLPGVAETLDWTRALNTLDCMELTGRARLVPGSPS